MCLECSNESPFVSKEEYYCDGLHCGEEEEEDSNLVLFEESAVGEVIFFRSEPSTELRDEEIDLF